MLYISVQAADFCVAEQYDAICGGNSADGAVVFFVGRMRDMNLDERVDTMTLEHYPGMTESVLADIAAMAQTRWSLNRIRIVHRIGRLRPAEQIVFVATSSPHRQAAFAGATFIMDRLKTEAPFWKKESTPAGERWLVQRTEDRDRADRW